MLVSSSKLLGLLGLLIQIENFLWCKCTQSFLQPQTPSHLVEDLQDVIKQESDESGIVAEFQENGQPLLKKIKQEVNMGSFEKNNPTPLVPVGSLMCLAWALWNIMFHAIFSYKMQLRGTARLGSICMPPCNWEAKPLLFPSCLNRKGKDIL